MTGFDSTWYHGPFAAGFFQSGNTWDLHFIAPQFLAWFYPANGEIFHAVGMLAFGRDVLSPLLNLGWFVGCLVACWCIGRPYRVAPWSLALGAIALSVPALADQAGEARNDIVGIFFLLAGVAIALNAWGGDGETEKKLGREEGGCRRRSRYLVVGLAAGLAAGTKLNFLLPAAVLVVGLALIAPRGRRWRALAAASLAALAGGGYWYLRNLVHTGNPLPWIHHLGPIDLPAPEQALGGREAHSVLGYLTNGTVWSDWFLPASTRPLVPLAPASGRRPRRPALAASRGSFVRRGTKGPTERSGAGAGRPRRACHRAGVAGCADVRLRPRRDAAWLRIRPPLPRPRPDPRPRAAADAPRSATSAGRQGDPFERADTAQIDRALARRLSGVGCPFGRPSLLLLAVAIGYPVQRHYLETRYKDPTFTTPGLNAAFAWARDISDARIATTSTRQYPLFGTDLSNHVQSSAPSNPTAASKPRPPATSSAAPQRRRLRLRSRHPGPHRTRQAPLSAPARWTKAPEPKSS